MSVKLIKEQSKKKDTLLSKRFRISDIEKWQTEANETHKGNLTAWMENVLNKAVTKTKKTTV